MASILALPNDLIELIGAFVNRRRGLGIWCRFTSTCRRLWKLQLPHSHVGLQLPPTIGIEGITLGGYDAQGNTYSMSHVLCILTDSR